MSLTITAQEVCDIRCRMQDNLLQYEDYMTKVNKFCSKESMSEGNELMMYVELLNDIDEHDFQNDTYVSILSNKDIWKMHNRGLEILNKTINGRTYR